MVNKKNNETGQLNVHIDKKLIERLKAAHQEHNKSAKVQVSFAQFMEQHLQDLAPEPAQQTDDLSLSYHKNPFWALVPKKQLPPGGPGGMNFLYPVKWRTIAGSPPATFNEARAKAKASCDFVTDFIVPHVQNTEIVAIMGTQAVKELMQVAKEEVYGNLGDYMEQSLFGDGSGVLGRVKQIHNRRITLKHAKDGVKFEVGMELDVITAGSQVRAYGCNGHGLRVVTVHHQDGWLECECPVNDYKDGCPTIQEGDGLVQRGDFGGRIFGIESWIPADGLNDTNKKLCGVDRSINPVRLAGCHLDGSCLSVEESLVRGSILVAQQGGEIDTVLCTYGDFAELSVSDSAKLRIVIRERGVDFPALQVILPTGPANVIASRCVPKDRIYGLKLDSWQYWHVGDKPVMPYELDGVEWIQNGDQLEHRIFTMGNLVCTQPWSNITIKRPA